MSSFHENEYNACVIAWQPSRYATRKTTEHKIRKISISNGTLVLHDMNNEVRCVVAAGEWQWAKMIRHEPELPEKLEAREIIE